MSASRTSTSDSSKHVPLQDVAIASGQDVKWEVVALIGGDSDHETIRKKADGPQADRDSVSI